ncbi:putative protein [Vanrija pseudolonga]|uniref:Purtative protein n=1 Tax=Vanrija pseudolonga TaxID=143232 RepID=A0AAF0YKT9_9TREE|nr:purtative protein [Vanrija pseudolonga]
MTRESPSLLGSSELRDVRLVPSSVHAANIAIIHPQLRDLVLPLARGHVLYPRGNAVEEARWRDADDEDDDGDVGISGGMGDKTSPPTASRRGYSGQAVAKTLFKIGFTPTCLTTSGAILACGGQKGELFLCDLPTGDRVQRASPVKPFALNLNLPSRSINNAITILPSYPVGWARRQAEVKRLYGQREPRRRDIDFEDDDESTLRDSDDEDADDLDDDMDIDDDSTTGGAQVLTYPNSIPFGHARRIPILGGDRNRRWSNTTSLSSQSPQYVTSHGSGRHRSPASSSEASRRSRLQRADEPRILVSNNDQTVKMFSLRRVDRERERERDQEAAAAAHARAAPTLVDSRYADFLSHTPLPPPRTLFGSSFGYDSIGLNEGILAQQPQVVPDVREHGRTRHTSNVGNLPYSSGESWSRHRERPRDIALSRASTQTAEQQHQQRALERERSQSQSQARATADGMLLNREIDDSEVEPRKLTRVGGTKFKLAVNHSSLSPDLRTMVTVGDSTEVFIYEVLDGGKEFRKIGVYSAATDYGFSTAWSKDGRKFAVASQDGQVTVWDHRTSKPLAIFHSSSCTPGSASAASSPVTSHAMGDTESEDERTPAILIDPVTGDPRLGSSTSGRDAARVVKFSPEGSSRDLLVFSEENYNIHIIDARTFNTHVVVPVPYDLPPPATPAPRRYNRHGVDGGTWGISGVAFDPTGDWLYAGTERTIVEWDMRRYGGGEGGTWAMA